MGGGRRSNCTLKQMMCFHGASPSHADRTSRRTAVRHVERAALAVGAVDVAAAAAAAG